MFDVLRRFGFGLSRAFALLLLLIAIGVGAVLWVGPLQPLPAELRLLALDENGQFGDSVSLPARVHTHDSSGAAFPLVLAARNVGARAATPRILSLSIPARYRLLGPDGNALPGERTPNNPLVRYRIGLPPVTIAPGDMPLPLSAADTLWLEPVLEDYFCTISGDGVPEFVAAPVYDPEDLARISIFYSFIGGSPDVRQTGILHVRIDPALVAREPAPDPPAFPVTVTEPSAPLPELGPLARGGFTSVRCGDPMRPIELRSILWLTASGGRFIILYHGGVPRKYLFDLDADGVVELEMWDPDGDGDFEARRQARYELPDYLLPPQPTDTLAVDSSWLATFHDTAAGPFRFLPDSLRPPPPAPPPPAPPARPDTARAPAARPRPDTTPRPAAAPMRRDTLVQDTLVAAARRQGTERSQQRGGS